jgi:hypothetical protein
MHQRLSKYLPSRKTRRQFLLLAGSILLLLACNIGTPSPPVTPTPPPAETQPSTATEQSQSWPLKDMSVRPQIWFGPLDPLDWSRDVPGGSGYDYFSLFSEAAPWKRAAEATQVMVLYPVWLSSAGQDQIRQVVDDLRRRHIAIAYEAGPLSEHGQCNAGTIEGFSGPPSNRQIAQNIKDAGGVLYTWEMEHGFDAATYYDPACRMTPREIAQDAAKSIAAVREVFPDVKIGSIETGNLDVKDITAWVSAYRDVTGEELAYLHLDVPYFIPDWAERAKEIEAYVRSRGIDFGIYYVGDWEDTSDAQWLGKAEQHFVEYEAVAGGEPDQAIFQSWNPHPVALLPEDQPNTFTWLINRYLRPRTSLSLATAQDSMSGQLTLTDGSPIPNATIEFSALPVTGQGVFLDYTVTGTVPDGATKADAGLRINNECDCSGPAELILGSESYAEAGETTNRVPNGNFRNGLNGWGTWGAGVADLGPGENGAQALHISAAPGQDVGLNSDTFPVTAGQPFTFTVRARVDPPTQGSGYFDIVFLTDTAETSRVRLPIAIARESLGSALTGPDGSYSFQTSDLTSGTWSIRALFAGSDELWPAAADSEFAP